MLSPFPIDARPRVVSDVARGHTFFSLQPPAFERALATALPKWMRRRKARLKVTGGIHILRHTFCSRLAMAGATPVAISHMAGHASLSTTQRYLHLSPAAMDKAIELLDSGADLAASPDGNGARTGDIVETGGSVG